MADWVKIKACYLQGLSYRQIAKECGVSASSICTRAKKEKWSELRDKKQTKSDKKLVNKLSTDDANMRAGLYSAVIRLSEKATEMIDLCVSPAEVKQLASTFKDIKDIMSIKSEMDVREQLAKIKSLEKQLESNNTDDSIRIVFGDDVNGEAYAQ